MMEPQACLNQLSKLLAEESNLLGTLAQQLQREHELLVANDVEGLEQAADARQASVASLSRLDQDRRNLCRVLGHGADHVGLAALHKWCDPSGSLNATHTSVATQAQKCRELNDRNGALVNARLNRLSNMLDMMNGNKAAPRTYEARGTTRGPATTPAGRMVSISA
jgi:flagellar biosynthesis/type III secretory pathway chaperone